MSSQLKNKLFTDLDKYEEACLLRYDGTTAYHRGAFEEAIRAYTLAANLAPNCEKNYLSRAKVYLEMNRPYDCIEDCNKALACNKKSANAYKIRACAQKTLGHLDEVKHDLRAAINIFFDEEPPEWFFIKMQGEDEVAGKHDTPLTFPKENTAENIDNVADGDADSLNLSLNLTEQNEYEIMEQIRLFIEANLNAEVQFQAETKFKLQVQVCTAEDDEQDTQNPNIYIGTFTQELTQHFVGASSQLLPRFRVNLDAGIEEVHVGAKQISLNQDTMFNFKQLAKNVALKFQALENKILELIYLQKEQQNTEYLCEATNKESEIDNENNVSAQEEDIEQAINAEEKTSLQGIECDAKEED